MGTGFILLHDNATLHRPQVVREFLLQQQVPRLDRLPPFTESYTYRAPLGHSGEGGGRVQDNPPSPANVGELFQFLQQEWKANP